MKLPAFQFYPGDWRKDPAVQSLSYHDRGVWMEILCLMHESERRGVLLLNGAAMPEDALARLLGLDKQNLTTTLTTLLTFGVAIRDPETGALASKRMVRDEDLRQKRANAGKQGGNPVLLKQIPTTRVKQIPTPSSSSSVSSSDNNTPIAPKGADEVLFPEDIAALPPVATRDIFQIRVGALFRRRASTGWSRSEERAWKHARRIVAETSDESWQLLEWWFGLPAERAPYRKTDMAALLNSWHAEIEKARRNKTAQTHELPRLAV